MHRVDLVDQGALQLIWLIQCRVLLGVLEVQVVRPLQGHQELQGLQGLRTATEDVPGISPIELECPEC